MKKYFSLLFLIIAATQVKAVDRGILNADTGDAAKYLVENTIKSQSINPKYKKYKLIAHRGGICENVFEEYDPRSIKAAIDSGYWMLEIDVRPTKDSVLVINHHDSLEITYGLSKTVSSMTYEELKKIKAIKGGYCPMAFEDLLKLMKKNNVKIMVDLKMDKPVVWFNRKVNDMLKKYDMLKDAVFLRNDVTDLYDGGRFGFRMNEMAKIQQLVKEGKDVANKYYLFDNGNRINAEAARWCQKNNIWVCPSVNLQHYTLEDPFKGAQRDIEYLIKCGVTMYQIDSDFDDYFN